MSRSTPLLWAGLFALVVAVVFLGFGLVAGSESAGEETVSGEGNAEVEEPEVTDDGQRDDPGSIVFLA